MYYVNLCSPPKEEQEQPTPFHVASHHTFRFQPQKPKAKFPAFHQSEEEVNTKEM